MRYETLFDLLFEILRKDNAKEIGELIYKELQTSILKDNLEPGTFLVTHGLLVIVNIESENDIHEVGIKHMKSKKRLYSSDPRKPYNWEYLK